VSAEGAAWLWGDARGCAWTGLPPRSRCWCRCSGAGHRQMLAVNPPRAALASRQLKVPFASGQAGERRRANLPVFNGWRCRTGLPRARGRRREAKPTRERPGWCQAAWVPLLRCRIVPRLQLSVPRYGSCRAGRQAGVRRRCPPLPRVAIPSRTRRTWDSPSRSFLRAGLRGIFKP